MINMECSKKYFWHLLMNKQSFLYEELQNKLIIDFRSFNQYTNP